MHTCMQANIFICIFTPATRNGITKFDISISSNLHKFSKHRLHVTRNVQRKSSVNPFYVFQWVFALPTPDCVCHMKRKKINQSMYLFRLQYI